MAHALWAPVRPCTLTARASRQDVQAARSRPAPPAGPNNERDARRTPCGADTRTRKPAGSAATSHASSRNSARAEPVKAPPSAPPLQSSLPLSAVPQGSSINATRAAGPAQRTAVQDASARARAREPGAQAAPEGEHGQAAWHAVLSVLGLCREQGLDGCLQGWAAALFQGVSAEHPINANSTHRLYSVKVQWDGLTELHDTARAVLGTATGPLFPLPGGSGFVLSLQQHSAAASVPVHDKQGKKVSLQGQEGRGPSARGSRGDRGARETSDAVSMDVHVLVWCERNTVVATEPNCTTIKVDCPSQPRQSTEAISVAVETLPSVRRNAQRRCGVLGAAHRHVATHGSTPEAPTHSRPMHTQDAGHEAAQHLAPPDLTLASAVTNRLVTLQSDMASHNSSTWADSDTYAAWVQRYGTPQEAAEWVRSAPAERLAAGLLRTMQAQGPLTGKRVTNLMGSHGLKALALACYTGETVTVVDVSPGNAQYAREVAREMGLPLRYVISDVLSLDQVCPPPSTQPKAKRKGDGLRGSQGSDELLWGVQDWVVMEQGILHYFIDLQPLFDVVVQLLNGGGHLLLRDFHPVSTKLITTTGNKHKVAGNYFASELTGSTAAFAKWTSDPGLKTEPSERNGVMLRKWTLGEVVTAVASAGLVIASLDEEGGRRAADSTYPKTFTLVARKAHGAA